MDVRDGKERLENGVPPEPDQASRAGAGAIGDDAGDNPMNDALADDIRWALKVRTETRVSVAASIAKLNQLLDDYETIREIGRGGMGVVYEARQVKLDRRVALKILPALVGAVQPEAASRFRREAMLAAKLQHTNIIPVHDFGQIDGTMYYAMELIAGRSLRDILREIADTGAIDAVLGAGSPGSDERTSDTSPDGSRAEITRLGASNHSDRIYFRKVAGWIADIAEALHYAHERGVIHRDVKPSNLLLADDGRLMLSDFGLARAMNDATLTLDRAMLGTCRFMSPEQLDESDTIIDRRVDVYGLGASMYEMLCFRPMFTGADHRDIASQVLNREPAPPRRFVRKVPQELETICLKAVEKRREERYGTAQLMADDLRRWLLDLPILARRPSGPARALRFVRRRKVSTLLSTICFILLVTAGVLFAKHRQSEYEAARVQANVEDRDFRLLMFRAGSDYESVRLQDGLRRTQAALQMRPNSIEAQLLRAKFLRAMGRNDEAITHFQEILELEPNCWAVHYALALAYNQNNDERAIFHRRQVERLRPETAPAYYLRALFETDPRRAIEFINIGLELQPDRIELVMALSSRFCELGQFEAMLAEAERAVSLRPNWSNTHGRRGRALFYLGRYADAIRSYGKAIELDPQFDLWWRCRAACSYEIGNYMEAIADADVAIRIDPDDPIHHVVRGKALAKFGDWDEALVELNRAMELSPTDIRAYLDRSVLYSQVNRWADVLEDSNRVIELDPNEERGFHNRAVCFMRTGQYENAIPDLSRAIELAPDNSGNYRIRAEARLLTHQFHEAIQDLTHVLESQPDNCLARMHRGLAYELTGAHDFAMDDYGRLGESDGEAGAYANLWKYILLRKNGRQEEAADVLQSAVEASSDESWVGSLLGLFNGTLSPQELVAAASNDSELFEAYYYAGMKATLDGHSEEARAHLTQGIAQGRWQIMQYTSASARVGNR